MANCGLPAEGRKCREPDRGTLSTPDNVHFPWRKSSRSLPNHGNKMHTSTPLNVPLESEGEEHCDRDLSAEKAMNRINSVSREEVFWGALMGGRSIISDILENNGMKFLP